MSGLVVDVRVEVPGFTVDAAFNAQPGITVLAGPSGSGKSLTLAAICGTIRPTRGVISVDNRVFCDVAVGTHLRSQDRQLGVVYQHAALLEHRSPLDNVALAVRHADAATRRSQARELLDRVGASGLVSKRTKVLSGGERQRVAIARALAGQPHVLLLDEPFSSLDATTRNELRQLVKTLVAERKLIALLVTHDHADVQALADQVVQYEPGRTVSAGE